MTIRPPRGVTPTPVLALGLALLCGGLWQRPVSAQAPDLAAVDAHVAAAPEKVESELETLAAYLAEAGPSELERARAVFYWVATNIAYDGDAFSRAVYGDTDPAAVLRSREAICSGYARLTEALGEAVGLDVEVVNGWSKGYGYTAGDAVDEGSNHSWNAVRIDGQWHLMDPTWGAGYLEDGNRFVHRLQEHYFLTDPNAFLFDHFPEEPAWQLVDRPIDRSSYGDLVFLRPDLFLNGLEIRSHSRGRIETDARVTVELGAPDTTKVLAGILDPVTGEDLGRTRTFVQTADGVSRIDAVFPGPGTYLLRVYARPKGPADAPYGWALDYRVRVRSGDPDGSFPHTFGSFHDRDAVLYEPMRGTLDAGTTQRFRVRAPGAITVAVKTGDEWFFLEEGAGDEYSGEVTVAGGDVIVYARYEEGTRRSEGLLRYQGR